MIRASYTFHHNKKKTHTRLWPIINVIMPAKEITLIFRFYYLIVPIVFWGFHVDQKARGKITKIARITYANAAISCGRFHCLNRMSFNGRVRKGKQKKRQHTSRDLDLETSLDLMRKNSREIDSVSKFFILIQILIENKPTSRRTHLDACKHYFICRTYC